MSEQSERMVQAIADESPTDFEQNFNVALAGKLTDALAQKKLEVSAHFLDAEEEEETIDEELPDWLTKEKITVADGRAVQGKHTARQRAGLTKGDLANLRAKERQERLAKLAKLAKERKNANKSK